MKDDFQKIWYGKYREINWEIKSIHKTHDNRVGWCFYLYIRLNLIPKNLRERFWLSPKRYGFNGKKNHVRYDYYSEPLINNLEWHGGCTWYEKIGGFDGHKRIVKVGCDYQHYWDEGKIYSFDYVYSEVKACIDSLLVKIPKMKHQCWYCGKIGLKNFVITDENSYRCQECQIENRRINNNERKEK